MIDKINTFLYISEDGSVLKGPAPTIDEIEQMEHGDVVMIVDCNKMVQYTLEEGWVGIMSLNEMLKSSNSVN